VSEKEGKRENWKKIQNFKSPLAGLHTDVSSWKVDPMS
jgi:hypothetical protein